MRDGTRFIASLSRVDGLVLMSSDLVLRGFGTEILTEREVPRFYVATGAQATPPQLQERDAEHYGMRHRSMIRYCGANPKSVGFVVSQDGYVRAITKRGGRVLMWENVQLQLSFDRDPEDKTTRARGSAPRLKRATATFKAH